MSQPIFETNHVWVWREKGDPQSLARETRDNLHPSPGHALIANRAIGLNPVDWKMIEWGHAAWTPGHVPGVDGAGVIVAVGKGVQLPIGLRVAYHQSLAGDGSFASFTSVDARSLIPIPQGVSDVSAAAAPCPGMTAWQALHKVPLLAGRDVLVTGAGGSVGLLLAQLAVRDGWRVWVTAAPSHREALLSAGIAGVLDYGDANWIGRMTEALGPRRLHAIFDTVSGEHARSLAPLVGYNGHVVCIQDRIDPNPLAAFTSAVSLHEVALNSVHGQATEEDWQEWRIAGADLFRMIEIGELQLPKIEVVPFDALPTALAALRSGARKGKLVAQPSEER